VDTLIPVRVSAIELVTIISAAGLTGVDTAYPLDI
jgi:hypothetical protein